MAHDVINSIGPTQPLNPINHSTNSF